MGNRTVIDTTRLVVDPFNTDSQRRWNWTSLGRALLNSAENHAKARNFGMMELNGQHFTWVLSRLTMEMSQMPEIYETVDVNTWIESVYRLFTNRNFSFLSPDGKVYGYARSVWAMIDYETRQPAQLEQLEGELFKPFLAPQIDCPIAPWSRIRPLCDADYVKSQHVRYSDIDMNEHVNSIKYIEHIMDLLPIEKYQDGHHLKRLEIAYMSESYYGDNLAYFLRQTSETTYEVEVRRKLLPDMQKGETVVRAMLTVI